MVITHFSQLQTYFLASKTRELGARLAALKNLRHVLKEHEQAIFDAAKKDFGRPELEVFSAELASLYTEIDFACKHLASWAKPQRAHSGPFWFTGKNYIYAEPYGLVLIIAPWNFPFLLSLLPLIHALAAGNCALIKPSEFAPAQALVIESIVQKSLDPGLAYVIQGDAHIAQELLTQPWDYIFFTGSVKVGTLVYQEAAKRLIPVTLELGGKNPVIVTQDADIKYAAKKIVWGKFFNAGQCCLAPDYVLVDATLQDLLVKAIQEQVLAFYGQTPQESPDYARIVNEAHMLRLKNLLAASTNAGAHVSGGNIDNATRYFSPTILTNVSLQNPIMQEEIFGPILPIIPYAKLDEAISIINQKPKPLALYIFSSSPKIQEKIVHNTSSGGSCINNVLLHHNSPHLPFGGVGASGIGAYHGKYGLDTFSHRKAILKSNGWLSKWFIYPPYKKWTLTFLRFWYR
jgi:acyl-CoA reductase-like NAD-dependent aldehyde dehydrogenase